MTKGKTLCFRTCVVCRTKGEKSNFLRVTATDAGVVFDKSGKQNGRGAYICKNADCVLKAKKTSAFSRAFKREVDSKIYDDLLAEV